MSERYVALVPLRGGSKGIPGKNIKPMAGRPLCWWSLGAACACERIAEVVVSTDCPRIADSVRASGLPVRILDRPAELADDRASTESVMLHAIEHLEADHLITLQATSPLTTTADLDAAIVRYQEDACDSLVTGVRQQRFLWSPEGRPLNYDPRQRPRRQDWDGSLIENGAFYITRISLLRESGCRLGGRIAVHCMAADTLAEIDEPGDWPVVEAALTRRLARAGGRPRVLVCDVDGTLTDGGMYYDADGEAMKRFDTRDAQGLARLRAAGLAVWIISGEDSAVVAARMRKLGLEEVHLGVSDKWPLLAELLAENDLSPAQCAYIGDDLNDLDCLERVGWSACPGDAQPALRAVARFVAEQGGGRGAVRAFCEHLLQSLG